MIYMSRARTEVDPLPRRRPGTHAGELSTQRPIRVVFEALDDGSQIRYSRDVQTLTRLRRGLPYA